MGGSDNKKIKILFLVNWWYPDRVSPLNGIFVKKHAEAVSHFVDVAVLYLGNDPFIKGGKIDCCVDKENGIFTAKVYYKKCHFFFSLLAQLVNQLRYSRAVLKGLKHVSHASRHWDMLHIHITPPPVFLFIRFLKFKHIPYIITEHSSAFLPVNLKNRPLSIFNTLFVRPFRRRVIKGAAAVTVPSKALQKGMQSVGFINRYMIIPNVVDTQCFYPHKNKRAESNGKIKLLHVSGLKKLKNVEGILRALKNLRESRNDFEFHIVGDGEEREVLEKTAADMELLNREVFFQGQKSPLEVAAAMREADIFVLFSDYENSPCVIVEAMASGLPVIATDVGGIPELVNEKTGILVNPQDETELSKKLNFMMDNYRTYDKNEIRKEAVKRFSYETIGQQFFAIYQTLYK
jgi:glycosyltransferase involved in cell wall biosynthesis